MNPNLLTHLTPFAGPASTDTDPLDTIETKPVNSLGMPTLSKLSTATQPGATSTTGTLSGAGLTGVNNNPQTNSFTALQIAQLGSKGIQYNPTTGQLTNNDDPYATPQQKNANTSGILTQILGGTTGQVVSAENQGNPNPTGPQGQPLQSTGLDSAIHNTTGSSVPTKTGTPLRTPSNPGGTNPVTIATGVTGTGTGTPTNIVPVTSKNTGTGTGTGTGTSITPTPINNAVVEQTALNGLNSDLSAGQQYTTQSGAFANGAMGRVNATTDAATADALAKAKGFENGLSAPQMQAQKELNDQAIGGQLNSNLMQLRGIQGAQGLRGGSAAAQQIGLLNTAGAQQQTAARQEQLDQLAAQQAGVQNFLSDNAANNSVNTANTQYNNQQADAEAAGRLSTPLTYAGLLQGARTGADADAIAQEGAQTAATAADNANTIAQGQLYYDENTGTAPAGSTAVGTTGY